jgi:hypothetical protein
VFRIHDNDTRAWSLGFAWSSSRRDGVQQLVVAGHDDDGPGDFW